MGTSMGPWTARFKLPPGGATDPSVRFSFDGDLGATPTQKFPLVTSDGAPGTIELIPGPAFNLLEVNFQTDPQANKIRTRQFYSGEEVVTRRRSTYPSVRTCPSGRR